jgi:stage V sporulation protein D (sporulation-specific penicillin-binding protein)
MSTAPTGSMRKKLFGVVFMSIFVAVVYIIVNLFGYSVVNAEYYRSKANAQQLDSFTINANRGTIYDRNGKVLAQSKTVWTVIMSPGDIAANEPENTELICQALSDILGVSYDKLIKAAQETKNRYYTVKTKIDEAQANAITKFKADNKIGVNSIYLVEDTKRDYPNDKLAASILGFINYDNDGIYGIEAYYNEELKGINGRVVIAKDANGNAMPYNFETKYEAQNGNSLVLTIDEVLQHYLEKHLETTVSQHQVNNRATGIIMNAKTGAILAMATSPGYDPNYPSTLSEKDRMYLEQLAALTGDQALTEEQLEYEEAVLREKQWRNKAISELYFPGSVFKVITAAAALEEEAVHLHSGFFCGGSVTVADTRFNCWRGSGHGSIGSLTEALTKSCNPAFIAIGQSLGIDKFTEYFAAFGFTEKTGIDLPGETKSLYVPRANMGNVELASSSFGQTNKITPIQMITAYAAAINGGYLLTPYIVDKIIDNEGNVIKTTEPTIKRQVISEETSALMRTMLEDVVTTNGGSNAYISGYRIGGKSGTSQKIDEYSNENMRYESSFCAFTPANDPDIIMLVVVDEPMAGQIYGSAVAAPVVSAVFKDSLEYLGHYAQYTAEEQAQQDTSVPYLIGSGSLAATTQLNTVGLNAEFVGNTQGGTVLYTVPGPGQIIPKGGTVVVYLEEQDYLTTKVPNVYGLSVEEANHLITSAGLNIRLSGGAIENSFAKASFQSIEPDTVVNKGTVVEVTFVVNDETG